MMQWKKTMTKEEIIELARKAGINYRELSDEFATGNGDGVEIEQMEAFAKLVAEKEREECAKICEKLVLEDDSFYGEFSGGKDCAKAIRERGKDA